MKHRFTSFLLMVLFSAMAFAGPVDLEKAKGKAAKFMLELNGSVISHDQSPEYAPARTIKGVRTAEQTPAYYVFNTADNNGYVIVSGDDSTDDILGYSTNGSFDVENLPSNVKAWLQSYAEQIAQMDNYIPQQHPAAYSASWTAIAPLTTTKWDQSAPYNNMCPIHYEDRSVTGCTATAIAQLMKYNEWPQGATQPIPGYTTETAKLRLNNLPSTTFNWDDMDDIYSSEDEADEVAKLMLYVGQALKSDYTRLATGAYSSDAASILPYYFGYDQNIELKQLSSYSISEWEEIIYEELRAKRPILHAGYSMEGGHAFVCDGYDGKGMFHFNWGWGGYCDGYYKLALMNPSTGGIGSGSSDGYSAGQQIVIGIQPPTGLPAKPKLLTPDREEITGVSQVSCAFFNMHPEVVENQVGFAKIDADNNIVMPLYTYNTTPLKQYYGQSIWMNIDYYAGELGAGTHRIATIARPDASYSWTRIGSRQKYFEVQIDNAGNIVSLAQSPIVKAQFAWECTGNLVAQMPQEVKITVQNLGDDLNTMFYLFASPSNTKGAAKSRTPILLKKNETLDFILTFTPETYGKWNLWLATDEAGSSVIATTSVEIKKAPTKEANLTLVSITPDINEVSAVIQVTNNGSEPYYRGIVAMLYENLYNDGYVYSTEQLLLPATIEPGQTQRFYAKFHGANSYTQCGIRLYYYPVHNSDGVMSLNDMEWFVTGETPVETIEATTMEESVGPVYRLDGTKVSGTMHKGIYISNGKRLIAR